MYNSRHVHIAFEYKGKTEKRIVDWMNIPSAKIKVFYRIQGKRINYDIYKEDGVWLNANKTGLSNELLLLVGNAIDEAESKI